MQKKSLMTLAFVALLLGLAFCSFFAARNINWHATSHGHAGDAFHQFLHEKLDLTETQNRKIQEIEDTYAAQRHALENRLRQANAELATVFKEEKAYTPHIQEKVDAIHHAMGELQKVTLEHIYAMYPHLTPDQQQKLQTYVTDALVQNPE